MPRRPAPLLAALLACNVGCRSEPPPPPPAVTAVEPVPEPPSEPPPVEKPRPIAPILGRGCTPLWLATEEEKPSREVARALGLTRWTLCDPTHESFLLAVLREAGLVAPDTLLTAPEVTPYLRGMLWNDDPEGLLHEDATTPAAKPRWLESYRAGNRLARVDATASLHARAQFGPLQLVHALRASAEQPVSEAVDGVYLWLEFTWRVAIGELRAELSLSQVPIEGFAALFPREAEWTIGRLLGGEDVDKRALGSFLHTLQDAYDPHHVQRANDDTGHGYVRTMGTAAGGRHSGHARAPGWRAGWEDGAVLWEVAPGLVEPFHRAVDLVQLASHRRPWGAARTYLEDHVLPRR